MSDPKMAPVVIEKCDKCGKADVKLCRSVNHEQPTCGECCPEARALERWAREMLES